MGGDQKLINFARGADVLIHDAQYQHEDYIRLPVPKQGWGHSTPEMAIAVAQAANARRLALYHHDPNHDDDMLDAIGRQARAQFANAFVASDGLSVEL